jgi:hypothetical protein
MQPESPVCCGIAGRHSGAAVVSMMLATALNFTPPQRITPKIVLNGISLHSEVAHT